MSAVPPIAPKVCALQRFDEECHNRLRAVAAKQLLFNHLVGAAEHVKNKIGTVTLGLQIQGLEFLASRPKTTKLVNRRSRWRERERLEWFRKHVLQVGFGADTNSDVGIKFLAGPDRHKIRHVFDQKRLDVAALFGTRERCDGPSFLRERRNRVDYFSLQPEQIFRRLDDNARKTDWWRRDLIVLERLQLPTRRLLAGQCFVDLSVDLVEVSRADELLQHRDMRVMSCVTAAFQHVVRP